MIDRSRAVLASIERHSARVDLPFERGDDLDDGGDEPEPHETVDRELVRPGNVRPPRRVQVEPDVGPGGKDLADALLLRLDPGVRVVVVRAEACGARRRGLVSLRRPTGGARGGARHGRPHLARYMICAACRGGNNGRTDYVYVDEHGAGCIWLPRLPPDLAAASHTGRVSHRVTL